MARGKFSKGGYVPPASLPIGPERPAGSAPLPAREGSPYSFSGLSGAMTSVVISAVEARESVVKMRLPPGGGSMTFPPAMMWAPATPPATTPSTTWAYEGRTIIPDLSPTPRGDEETLAMSLVLGDPRTGRPALVEVLSEGKRRSDWLETYLLSPSAEQKSRAMKMVAGISEPEAQALLASAIAAARIGQIVAGELGSRASSDYEVLLRRTLGLGSLVAMPASAPAPGPNPPKLKGEVEQLIATVEVEAETLLANSEDGDPDLADRLRWIASSLRDKLAALVPDVVADTPESVL